MQTYEMCIRDRFHVVLGYLPHLPSRVGEMMVDGLDHKHTAEDLSLIHILDANISSAYEQLLDMEEYQKEEVQEEHVAKSAFRR